MNRSEILPCGSVIEKSDKKYIILDYDFLNKEYLCAAYPTYYLTDLVPSKYVKAYKEKYNNYNDDQNIAFTDNFTVVFTGYKNEDFEKLVQNSAI